MPRSIAELLTGRDYPIEAQYGGAVPWGAMVPDERPGLFAVSLVRDPLSRTGAIEHCPLSGDRLAAWLAMRPALTLAGEPVAFEVLAEYLRRAWLPDETLLFVHRASQSLRLDIADHYSNVLFRPGTEADGSLLGVLSCLGDLWVHWIPGSGDFSSEHMYMLNFWRGTRTDGLAERPDPPIRWPFAKMRVGDSDRAHWLKGW